MDDKDSNHEVPGFEDLEDMEEFTSNHQQGQEQDEGKSKGGDSPTSNSNSNGIGNMGSNYGGQRDDSCSKTRTVSFSQNDLSEELLKVSQKSRLAVKEVTKAQEEEVHAPPGFGSRTAKDAVGLLHSSPKPKEKLDSVQSTDMGADINSQNSFEEPPGFEKLKEKRVNQLRTKSKHTRIRTGRRLGDSISSSSTNETTESMLRIAHESIQVGELLGV